MKNLISDKDLDILDNKGSILKKNVLTNEEINNIKSIVLKNLEGKGVPDSSYAINFQSFFIKFLKLNFNKISDSFYLIKLKKKLNLDYLASKIFRAPAKLLMLDGYYNKKMKNEILPWHSDQAYSGRENIIKFKKPDFFIYKFFIYLTEVGPNNGCTSYIPQSHLITRAVRSCIYNKEIEYQPFWSLQQLINIINYKDNFEKILKKMLDKEVFFNFLNTCEKCIQNNNITSFDFSASPGDMLIFNDTGLHRGSSPTLNERIVLRYLFAKK